MKQLKSLRKRTKILIATLTIALLFLALFLYCLYSLNEFQTYYLDVMKTLNDSKAKEYMLTELNGTNNLTDILLDWEQKRLTWANGSFTRYSDPQSILNQGKGKCEEYSIVYSAACLALGYEARLLVSRQFYLAFLGLHGFHVWTEVKLNGSWVQFDPSPTPFWNDTSRYRGWDWGPRTTLNVLAFEDGRIEDVSSRYR
jgi:hypothetical protein